MVSSPILLDFQSSTPCLKEVVEEMSSYWRENFANPSSKGNLSGLYASASLEVSRNKIQQTLNLLNKKIIFTSGATESNNLALLGFARNFKQKTGRYGNIITLKTEHKAVLEPIRQLKKEGFSVTELYPESDGLISEENFINALRDDTFLISIMLANNEIGVIQPIEGIAETLESHDAYFHVDAAQSFGKLPEIKSARIDLISVSGHKIYAPKGIGALVARRRGRARVPLTPLMVGGGQERGQRPGTLPVHLIVGLGEASRLATKECDARTKRCLELRAQLLECFSLIPYQVNGQLDDIISSTLSVSLTGMDAEAAIVCLKEVVAISNGAACTSTSYQTSHVLTAMGLDKDRARGTLRWSWCHMTPDIPVDEIREALVPLTG